LLLVVAAAVPFTFTFDANRFFRSLRDAEFIPFASLRTAGQVSIQDARRDGRDAALPTTHAAPVDRYAVRHPAAFAAWRWHRSWARWIAECASFVLLGLLVYAALRVDYGFSRNAAVALCLWIGGGLSFLLSGLHLFITTRSFDITDILARLSGLSLAKQIKERTAEIARVRDYNQLILNSMAEGLLAICIQHELDHLNGVVFLDRMPDLKSLTYLSEYDRYVVGQPD